MALIGDSIMNQASCSLAESLAQVGVQTGRYAVDGSGLLTGPVDWVKALPVILQKEHPSAVVAIFVGNYANPHLRIPTEYWSSTTARSSSLCGSRKQRNSLKRPVHPAP